MSEEQKERLMKGLRKLLLEYGIGLNRNSLKGLRGLPWIDYEVNQQEQKGVPKPLVGYKATNSTYWKRKYGIDDSTFQKDEVGVKVGKMLLVFKKENNK